MKLIQQPSFLFRFIPVFLFLLLSNDARAQEPQVYEFNDTAAIHIVTMKTGTVMRGKVLQIIDNDIIVLEFQGKRLQLGMKNIVRIDVTGPDPNSAVTQHYPYKGQVRPGIRSENLFFSSTGFALNKGEKELLVQIPALTGLVTMEWGLGKGFSFTAGYAFPAVLMFKGKGSKTLTPGLSVGGGVATLTPLTFPDETIFLTYGILTFGSRKQYFNLNAGPVLSTFGSDVTFLISPGFSLSLGKNFRLAGETYIFFEDEEANFTYLLVTLGWSANNTWGFDFGIINLSEEATDDFGPLPYLGFNYRF